MGERLPQSLTTLSLAENEIEDLNEVTKFLMNHKTIWNLYPTRLCHRPVFIIVAGVLLVVLADLTPALSHEQPLRLSC